MSQRSLMERGKTFIGDIWEHSKSSIMVEKWDRITKVLVLSLTRRIKGGPFRGRPLFRYQLGLLTGFADGVQIAK
jgi:hypothetical protein